MFRGVAWPVNRVERVRDLRADGRSAAAASVELGVTRNAVRDLSAFRPSAVLAVTQPQAPRSFEGLRLA
jgi:hypothetical protein